MLKLCDDIDTMAMTLLDGELAQQEVHDMDLHLLGCPPCKAHVERERAAHLLRRQRLAAPPAPALLRARLNRALDEVDRARRPSRRAYVLPGGAALAAVAALVLFVAMSRPQSAPVQRDPTIAAPAQTAPRRTMPVLSGGMASSNPAWSMSDVKIRLHGTEVLGADVARLTYAILTPDGGQLDIAAIVVGANRIALDPASAMTVAGYEVWATPHDGTFVRDGGHTMILTSSTLSQREILSLVGETLLVPRIGDDAPR